MNPWAFRAAVALVLAVNGLLLAGVAWNRTGTPDANVLLTERELPLASSPARAEDSGVSLRLRLGHWSPVDDRWHDGGLAWLTGPKLEALGFTAGPVPQELSEAYRFAHRQVARRGWVVLQLGGSAWAAWQVEQAARLAALAREVEAGKSSPDELKRATERLARLDHTGSRLFLVDAGPDPDALRAAHPDRTSSLVLPASFTVNLVPPETGGGCLSGGCRLQGQATLLVEEVVVPRALQANLPTTERPWRASEGGPEDGADGARYEVLLQVGRRREPWIDQVRPLAPARP